MVGWLETRHPWNVSERFRDLFSTILFSEFWNPGNRDVCPVNITVFFPSIEAIKSYKEKDTDPIMNSKKLYVDIRS